MISPKMSLEIWMNGPVARAGLMWHFSSVSGTTVPKMVANITTMNSEHPTYMVTARLPGMVIRL